MIARKLSRVTSLSAIAGILLTGTSLAQTSDVWPKSLQPLPENFGYHTPEESLATFTLPPGYQIDLVASEPLIGDAIVMKWDYQGRLWVVETTFMQDLDSLTSSEPGSSVAYLEDTDGDGKMDKRTVFADGLILPRSLLILDEGKVIIGEPPHVVLLEDTDGDGVADKREVVADSFGAQGGSIEHSPNGLFWNIDNRIYSAYLEEVYTWNGSGFDIEGGVSRSQWGIAADDEGRLYRQGNSAAPSVSYLPDVYYARNSFFDGTRGNNEWIAGPTRAANFVWPARPTPGINRGYQEGMLRADGTLAELTSAGGAAIYRGTAMGDAAYGDIFVPEPAGNLVTRSTIKDTGNGLFLEKAYERADFLTSTEERFRPVWTENGPDGAFYVLDLYHGIVQDAVFLTNYLKDWVDQHDLGTTHGANGRVYRISHENGAASEIVDLTKLSAEELVGQLSNENGWYRDHAQRLIVVQQKTETAPALIDLVRSQEPVLARLHALWTLDGLNAVTEELVIEALASEDREIRSAGLRIAEKFIGDDSSSVVPAFLATIGNANDWSVRYQLAASAGALGDANRIDAILDILSAYGADYVVVDGALSGLRDADITDFFNRLLAVEGENAGVKNALTATAIALIKHGNAEQASSVLDAVASADRAEWQREAALVGVEVVLAGATDPGLAPAVPRQQLGPRNVEKLGDTHFVEFRDGVNALDAEASELVAQKRAAQQADRPAPALADVEGVPTLVLENEPTAFLALGSDEALAARIEAASALISWPGKDG